MWACRFALHPTYINHSLSFFMPAGLQADLLSLSSRLGLGRISYACEEVRDHSTGPTAPNNPVATVRASCILCFCPPTSVWSKGLSSMRKSDWSYYYMSSAGPPSGLSNEYLA